MQFFYNFPFSYMGTLSFKTGEYNTFQVNRLGACCTALCFYATQGEGVPPTPASDGHTRYLPLRDMPCRENIFLL